MQSENYPLVKIWTAHDWKKHTSNTTSAGINQDTERRYGKNKDKEAIRKSMSYIQDQSGESIREGMADLVTAEARSVFFRLLEVGMAPSTWGDAGAPSRIYYRQVMYAFCPALQLCEGHWKAERLATDIYPKWWTNYGQFGKEGLAKFKTEASDRLDGKSKKRKATPAVNFPDKRTRIKEDDSDPVQFLVEDFGIDSNSGGRYVYFFYYTRF